MRFNLLMQQVTAILHGTNRILTYAILWANVASYVVHTCPTLVHIKQNRAQHEIKMDTASVKHGFVWIQCGAVDPYGPTM